LPEPQKHGSFGLTFGWSRTNGVVLRTSSPDTFAATSGENNSAACRRARYRFNLLRFDLPLKQTVKYLRCIYNEQDL